MSNRAHKLFAWLAIVMAHELTFSSCFALTSRQEGSKRNESGSAVQVAHPGSLLGIAIRITPAYAKPGDEVTVVAKTKPHVRLHIEVQDAGLGELFRLWPTVADQSGEAAWHFFIDKNYRADRLPIIVTANAKSSLETKVVGEISVRQNSPSFPLSFVAIPSAVAAGQQVTATIKTQPHAKVRIEAQGAGFSQAGSLLERTADKNGTVSWRWRVPADYTADVMPVIVTGDYLQAERKIIARLKISPQTSMAQRANPR